MPSHLDHARQAVEGVAAAWMMTAEASETLRVSWTSKNRMEVAYHDHDHHGWFLEVIMIE